MEALVTDLAFDIQGNHLVLCSCSNENSLSSLGKRMTVQQEPSTDVRAVWCILDISLYRVQKRGGLIHSIIGKGKSEKRKSGFLVGFLT